MSLIGERDLLKSVPAHLYINGEWREATGGRTFDVVDPATGETLKTVADATGADAAAAMDAAAGAFESWSTTPARVRSDILRRAFDLLAERAEEFALLMTLEMGKPLAEARGEVTYGNEFVRWFSEEAVRISGRYNPSPEGHGRMIVSQHAVGPAYLITPWNFPLAMATRKIAPALAAGCTVVIKPAELTPLTTLAYAELLAEAGVPGGVVNVLTTQAAPEVSEVILADDRLRKLSFTGSTPVGKLLMSQAADKVLRTSMELGGQCALHRVRRRRPRQGSRGGPHCQIPQYRSGLHGRQPVHRPLLDRRGVRPAGDRAGYRHARGSGHRVRGGHRPPHR